MPARKAKRTGKAGTTKGRATSAKRAKRSPAVARTKAAKPARPAKLAKAKPAKVTKAAKPRAAPQASAEREAVATAPAPPTPTTETAPASPPSPSKAAKPAKPAARPAAAAAAAAAPERKAPQGALAKQKAKTPEALRAALPAAVRPLADALRALVNDVVPDASERVSLGTFTFSRKASFCYVTGMTEHATLGFPHGAGLPDPEGRLEGAGKEVRFVKVRSLDDLPREALAALVREAAARAGA